MLILHCLIKNFKVMKISVKTILVTLALVLSIVAKGESNNKQIPIELVKTEKKETIVPRTPSYIPIECIYNYGTLEFSFFEDLGNINVSITNLTTGFVETTTIDTSCGGIRIDVSNSFGEYIVIIDTEIATYSGYYSID